MLFVSVGALEKCAPDKGKITFICPSIWIHYVIAGKGYYNGQTVTAGRAFVVYKNDILRYFPDPEDPWTYIWMRFEGDDDEKLLQRCGLPQGSGIFSFNYSERLTELANALFDVNSPHISNRIYGEAVAKMILSLHIGEKIEPTYTKDVNWVMKAKGYIAANYHRKLKVEQIAEALHIDRQYLRTLFVKHTGMSTKEYLDSYRMSRAAELLKMQNISVHIVAISVGYSDPLAFSKAFKKHYGVSPSEYTATVENNT